LTGTSLSITDAALAGAAKRALRYSLADLGSPWSEIRAVDDSAGVYHVVNLQRFVQIKAAILPSQPPHLDAREIDSLEHLARQFDGEPWEVRVLLRSLLEPSAIIWRNVGRYR
jgi:hypothetical protein